MDTTTEIREPQVTVIPAKPKDDATTGQRKYKRVAAYCRVSTDDEEQLTSYEAQCDYYTKLINSHEGWKPVKVFADEGITGTQAKKRPEFLKMIRYCRQRKIDIILAKSVSRFARNTVESLQYVRELRALGIAVIFEKEALNTLEQKDEMLIHAVMLPDGKHLADLEKKKMALNKEIGKLLDQSFKENDYTKYDSEFKRLSDELTAVSKEITEEQERLNECEASAANVQDILAEIENTEFRLDMFDEAFVRHSVEQVTIVDKNTIKVKISQAESIEIPL